MDDCSIKDLARREPDAPIFTRLGLTYGKAVKFRKEFGERLQSVQSRLMSLPVKPTMAAIASLTPETRRCEASDLRRLATVSSVFLTAIL